MYQPAASSLGQVVRRKRASAVKIRSKGLRRLTLEQLESRNLLSISGNVLTDNIFPVGDRDAHYLDITSQQLAVAGGQYVVTLAVSGGLGEFKPRARLEAPGGSLLGSEIDAGASRMFKLTDAGRYTVRVQDNDDRDTGTYALALEGIQPPSLDAQQIKRGDLKSYRLDVMGEVDAYTFTADAGDIVTLSLSESHSGSRATLYSPAGDKVKLYSSSTGNRVSQVTPGSKVLSEPLGAGTYVIQVHDNSYRAIGDYQLAFEGLVPPSADAVTLTLGETATGDIVAGEIDAFQFAANGSEIVSVSLSDLVAGMSSRLWAELYSPSGSKVSKLPGTNGPSEVENGNKVVYRLPAEAGTYVIQVYDYDYTHPEPYGVTLAGLSPPSVDAVAIGLGDANTGTIDAISEVDTFYYTLSAADLAASGGQVQTRLSFSSETTVSYKPRARLFAPTGDTVGQELNAGDTKSMTLTQAGTYVIQVYDSDYTHTKDELISRGKDPEYTVRLEDAQPPAVQSILASESLLTDFHAGPAKFAVTVVFNETMDTGILPTLAYSPLAVAGGQTPTLSNPAAVWYATAVSDDTITITYDVADRNLNASDISISVMGAKDLAGNTQQIYQMPSAFSIDMQNPFVSLFTPRDNAVRVSPNVNLVMTFAEIVEKNAGSILIKRSGDASIVETIAVDSPQVTVSGTVVTILPAEPFLETTGYYVEVSAGAFRDLAGNDFAGIHGGATWNFTTGDFTPPVVVGLWPADDATDIAWDTELRIVFDEPVRVGLGQITLKRSSDDATVESISVSSGQVAVSEMTVTIVPTVRLTDNTSYYVEVSSGAIEDLAGNGFAGISDPTAWNFTALDAPPEVLALSPVVGASGVVLEASLQITFDQPVRKGVGDIVIKRTADNSTFQTISVADDRVTVSDALITVRPALMLERRTSYYVEIAAGAFEDFTANPFAGFNSPADWSFATVGPLVVDDAVMTREDTPLDIAVLNNDSGVGRPMDGTSLTIVTAPSHGMAVVQDSSVIYTPAANFSGHDAFQYTVSDHNGFRSNVGTVTITVVEVPDYQNPDLPEDVNRSGAVTPLDVLIGINRINAIGNQLPPDPIPPEIPLYYYDVDGNGLLEPLDLLLIINYLNQATTPGEGESGDHGTAAVAAFALSQPLPPLGARQAGRDGDTIASRASRAVAAESAWNSRLEALPDRPWASQVPLARSRRYDAALAALQRHGEDRHSFALDEILPLVVADVAQTSA
jgi:hypothetical protein